jgi:hypothetical protein
MVFVGLSAITSLHAQPQIGGSTCTNSTLSGPYSYVLSGSLISGGQAEPYAELGRLNADGHGKFTGGSQTSINGSFTTHTLSRRLFVHEQLNIFFSESVLPY